MWNKLRVESWRKILSSIISSPAVVGLVFAELEEVETCLRSLLQVEIHSEVTHGGLDHHRHFAGDV